MSSSTKRARGEDAPPLSVAAIMAETLEIARMRDEAKRLLNLADEKENALKKRRVGDPSESQQQQQSPYVGSGNVEPGRYNLTPQPTPTLFSLMKGIMPTFTAKLRAIDPTASRIWPSPQTAREANSKLLTLYSNLVTQYNRFVAQGAVITADGLKIYQTMQEQVTRSWKIGIEPWLNNIPSRQPYRKYWVAELAEPRLRNTPIDSWFDNENKRQTDYIITLEKDMSLARLSELIDLYNTTSIAPIAQTAPQRSGSVSGSASGSANGNSATGNNVAVSSTPLALASASASTSIYYSPYASSTTLPYAYSSPYTTSTTALPYAYSSAYSASATPSLQGSAQTYYPLSAGSAYGSVASPNPTVPPSSSSSSNDPISLGPNSSADKTIDLTDEEDPGVQLPVSVSTTATTTTNPLSQKQSSSPMLSSPLSSPLSAASSQEKKVRRPVSIPKVPFRILLENGETTCWGFHLDQDEKLHSKIFAQKKGKTLMRYCNVCQRRQAIQLKGNRLIRISAEFASKRSDWPIKRKTRYFYEPWVLINEPSLSLSNSTTNNLVVGSKVEVHRVPDERGEILLIFETEEAIQTVLKFLNIPGLSSTNSDFRYCYTHDRIQTVGFFNTSETHSCMSADEDTKKRRIKKRADEKREKIEQVLLKEQKAKERQDKAKAKAQASEEELKAAAEALSMISKKT